MTPYEKLLKVLPKKYHERVRDFTEENDLVDDCKYLIHISYDWYDTCPIESGGCWPVKSISEAVNFIKHSLEKI